jgi:hypothetical protein
MESSSGTPSSESTTDGDGVLMAIFQCTGSKACTGNASRKKGHKPQLVQQRRWFGFVRGHSTPRTRMSRSRSSSKQR